MTYTINITLEETDRLAVSSDPELFDELRAMVMLNLNTMGYPKLAMVDYDGQVLGSLQLTAEDFADKEG